MKNSENHMTMHLTQAEMAKCEKFAWDAARTQQKIEFGQHGRPVPVPRPMRKFQCFPSAHRWRVLS